MIQEEKDLLKIYVWHYELQTTDIFESFRKYWESGKNNPFFMQFAHKIMDP
jgi:hypothetical protein